MKLRLRDVVTMKLDEKLIAEHKAKSSLCYKDKTPCNECKWDDICESLEFLLEETADE